MAPMVMLMMVSHTSVTFCGGHLPKPMHSMWDMALKSAHEYCSKTGTFCMSGWGYIGDTLTL